MRTERLLASSVALAVASAAHSQVHVYVDDDAPDGGNGLSWNSAMNDLHRAIDIAHKLGEFRGEIRIAGGTYKPDDGTGDPTRAFVIPPSIHGAQRHAFVGGFAGLANPSNPNERDTELYRSIIDADLLGNDSNDAGSRSDNANTLMFFEESADSRAGVVSGIILDGLEFRGASVGAIRSVSSGVSLSFVGCRFFGNWGGDGSVMQLQRQLVMIDNCEITGNRSAKAPGVIGGGALDFGRCDVVVRDSLFQNNQYSDSPGQGGDAYGGALAVRSGTLFVDDAEFRANWTGGRGGAIYLNDTVASIDYSEFELNSANFGYGTGAGGAIYLGTGELELRGCDFNFNDAQAGGAIVGISEVKAYETRFENNSAVQGGAFVGLGDFRWSEFKNNAGSFGGAMTLVAGSQLEGCVLLENSASLGGAIDVGTGDFDMNPIVIADSRFEGNSATSSGGAIRNTEHDDGIELNIDNCEFVDNSSGGAYGAVFGAGTISDSLFEGNTAHAEGGAVHTAGSVMRSLFRDNRAGTDGGAVYGAGLVESCDITDNIATRDGGGVYHAGTVRNTAILSNRASRGGGVFNAQYVENSDVSSNHALTAFGGYYSNSDGYTLISDSVFAGNTVWTVQTGFAIGKLGDGRLDIVRSTVVNTEDGADEFLSLMGGETWVESSIIHDDTSDSSVLVRIADGAPTVFVHSNLRTDDNAILFEDADDLYLLGGNISGDPLFVDAASGNFRLSSGSPCIDAGFVFDAVVDGYDIYGQSRQPLDDPGTFNSGQGAGGFLDIGAVEFQGTTCLADVNGDGSLTAADFTAWLSAYNTGNRRADQNLDGFIDQGDFTAWISNYSAGCN